MPANRRWCAVAALVVMLSLLAPLTSRADTGAPTRTVIHYVTPWGVGTQAEPLIDTVDGGDARCDLLAFLREYRSDVYRCFYGNFRNDTCFAGGLGAADNRQSFVCMSSPFDPAPVLVQSDVSGFAPWEGEPGRAPDRYPWYLELADGTRCGLEIGFAPAVADQRVNYGCDDGGHLFGFIDRSQPRWQVNYLPTGTIFSTAVDITEVWY